RTAVAIDSNFVAIAASADSSVGTFAGSVSIYQKVGSVWSLEAKITASDPKPNQNFGSAISLKAGRILVGAYGDTVGRNYSGAAYIYRRATGSPVWSLETKLALPSEISPFANFGCSVSLATNAALIGASFDQNGGVSSGSAYVYRLNGTL